jgi:phospholipid transport system substrate-binding protein
MMMSAPYRHRRDKPGHDDKKQRSRKSVAPCLLAIAVLGFLALATHGAKAEEHQKPEDVVAAFDDALLGSMREAEKFGYAGRYDRLAPVMNNAFDFAEMTRIAVGGPWASLTGTQQHSLADAFARFSIANYAREFDKYSGERIEITGHTERPQGVVIATAMKSTADEPTEFDYLLHKVNGAWKIVDIYLDGSISQLAVRRSEFSAVLTRSGPEGLLRMLTERTDALAK